MRIDKYLWAVRIFKTRSNAAEACDKSKVKVNDAVVKASRNLKAGDKIAYAYGSLTRTFEVIALLENRVGAKDVANYCIETTPKEDLLNHIAMRKAAETWRAKGSGRPTKKDRRELDDFTWVEILKFDFIYWGNWVIRKLGYSDVWEYGNMGIWKLGN